MSAPLTPAESAAANAAATDAQFPCCDTCSVVLTDDNAGPSCGACDACVECAPWATCRGCVEVMRVVNAERRAEADFDYLRGA